MICERCGSDHLVEGVKASEVPEEWCRGALVSEVGRWKLMHKTASDKLALADLQNRELQDRISAVEKVARKHWDAHPGFAAFVLSALKKCTHQRIKAVGEGFRKCAECGEMEPPYAAKPPEHICGLQGFGRGAGGINDVCDACEYWAKTEKRVVSGPNKNERHDCEHCVCSCSDCSNRCPHGIKVGDGPCGLCG